MKTAFKLAPLLCALIATTALADNLLCPPNNAFSIDQIGSVSLNSPYNQAWQVSKQPNAVASRFNFQLAEGVTSQANQSTKITCTYVNNKSNTVILQSMTSHIPDTSTANNQWQQGSSGKGYTMWECPGAEGSQKQCQVK